MRFAVLHGAPAFITVTLVHCGPGSATEAGRCTSTLIFLWRGPEPAQLAALGFERAYGNYVCRGKWQAVAPWLWQTASAADTCPLEPLKSRLVTLVTCGLHKKYFAINYYAAFFLRGTPAYVNWCSSGPNKSSDITVMHHQSFLFRSKGILWQKYSQIFFPEKNCSFWENLSLRLETKWITIWKQLFFFLIFLNQRCRLTFLDECDFTRHLRYHFFWCHIRRKCALVSQ